MKTNIGAIAPFRGAGLTIAAALSLAPAGCSSSVETESAASATTELSAPISVSEFVLFGGRVRVEEDALVTLGHVGASASSGDAVRAGKNSRLALGKAVLGKRVVLEDGVRAGTVFTNDLRADYATLEGKQAFYPPPDPPPQSAFSAGTRAVYVASGYTVSLAAGQYGTLSVRGTLRLLGGTYDLANLQLGNYAVITADAPSLVRIAGQLYADERVRIAPSLSASAADLRLVIAGTGYESEIGDHARITALVNARGSLRIGDDLIFAGAIAAGSVRTGEYGRITFNAGFQCNSHSGCEDGNACTVNQCLDGLCASTTVPNDATCQTALATAGTCQAGVCAPVPSVERIQQILTICTTCHAGPTPSAQLDLSDIRVVRDNHVPSGRCTDGISLLEPGNPGGSYLFLKILDTPACPTGRTNCGATPEVAACRLGLRMPRNLPALLATEIEEVRQWVVAGAP